MVIVVGAMIGAGKTSLAELIGEHFGTKVLKESVEDNPILPLYYGLNEEEVVANDYPFKLQLYFLDTRFKSIKEALTHKNNVLDRSIYEDLYFATVNKNKGNIDDLEFSIYMGLFNNMMEEIEGMPKKAPDLMVYLTGSFETILERINKRGREYELAPELIEYYRELWSGYDDWIYNHYNASEVLVIDIDRYDYVNNPEHAKEVLQMIEDKLAEVRASEELEEVE